MTREDVKVEEVFVQVARMILSRIDDGLIDPKTMVSGVHSTISGAKSLADHASDAAGSSCSC